LFLFFSGRPRIDSNHVYSTHIEKKSLEFLVFFSVGKFGWRKISVARLFSFYLPKRAPTPISRQFGRVMAVQTYVHFHGSRGKREANNARQSGGLTVEISAVVDK
jgi:hypothetical protein